MSTLYHGKELVWITHSTLTVKDSTAFLGGEHRRQSPCPIHRSQSRDDRHSNVSEGQNSHFMDAELEGGGGVEVSLNKSSSRGCCHTTTNPTGYFRGSFLVSLNVWLLTTH